MVLSGLVHTFQRLLGHVWHTSCLSVHSDTDVQCGDQVLFVEAMEQQSQANAQASQAAARIGPMKRKLDELDAGAAADFHRVTTVRIRPCRQNRDDLQDGVLPERAHADLYNPGEAQSLNVESESRDEDGNAPDDSDAVLDEKCAGTLVFEDAVTGLTEERVQRDPCALLEVKFVEEQEACIPPPDSRTSEESQERNYVVHETGGTEKTEWEIGSMEGVRELEDCRAETIKAKVQEKSSCSRLGASSKGAEYQIGLEEAFPQINRHCPGSSSTSSSEIDFTAHASCSNLAADRFHNTRLQFFVRTYIDGRTIVLHANAYDVIEHVHRQIFLRTGLPMSEQRLIYCGRQLQHDQTLAECRLANDATLFLVARMRSTALPRSWQLVNNLVTTIRHTCTMRNQEGPFGLKLMQAQDSIKCGVRDFLKMASKSAPMSEHLQVFQLSGATSSLVLLLLSDIESNRECAEDSIRLFLSSNEDCLPSHICSQRAPLLLDFCKLLSKCAPTHTLYPVCRSALGSLLDADGAGHGSAYFSEPSAETIVHDFAPFVNELSTCLSFSLQWAAKERSAHFASCFREAQDFNAFITPLCKAISVYKEADLTDWVLVSPKADDETCINMPSGSLMGTLCITCTDASKDVDFGRGCMQLSHGASSANGLDMVVGSQLWLQKIFLGILQDLDSCLAVETAGLAAGDEKSYGWAPYLAVLKGLYTIAKLYSGAMDALLTMLQSRRSALNLLIKQSRWQDDHSWLLDHRFLLDFDSKKKLVMAMLPEPQDDHDDRQEIFVQRSHLLPDSFESLAYADPDVLQGGISLEFSAEEATGPGVLREWFSLICREIFNPQNALFLSCPSDRRRIFPNPASGVNPGHLTYFRFSGRVMALALMHRVHIDVVLASIFFKQLAGFTVTWEDTRDADPVLFESCKKILELNAEVVDSDALGLTFVCDEEELGIIKAVELCPGGKDMQVNSQNRLNFVQLLVERRFVTSVSEQVKSFSQGFSDLLVNGNVEHFLKGLDLEDLDLMLNGNGQEICLEDWKSHTEYHDYSCSDAQIIWFWQVVEGMTAEQRRKLLFFSTSVTHLPIEGFAGLPSKFHIHKAHTDMTWLPTAHTCFYQLVLPLYPSLEVMQSRLLALTEGHMAEGFGFA